MPLVRLLIIAALLGSMPVYGQESPSLTICCAMEKEREAELAFKKLLGPVNFLIMTGNYPACETLLAKARKLQHDSFSCCAASQYLILDATTLFFFAKKDYSELLRLTSSILKFVDTLELRYRNVSTAADSQMFSYTRLITLQKRYTACINTQSIDEPAAIDHLIDSLRSLTGIRVSSFEIPYLLSRAQYFHSFKEYNEAKKSVRNILSIRNEEYDNSLQQVAAYNQLALIYFDEGFYREAVLYCDSGLLLVEKLPLRHPFRFIMNFLKAPLLMNKGIALTRLGELNNADKAFSAALLFYKGSNDTTGITFPRILHNYGVCDMFRGDYATAYSRITSANGLYTDYLLRYFVNLQEDDKYQLKEIVDEAFHAMPLLLSRMPVKDRIPVIRQIYNEQLVMKGLVFNSQRLIRSALREEKDTSVLRLYQVMRSASQRQIRGIQQNITWSAKEITELEKIRKTSEEELYRKSAVFRKIAEQLKIDASQVQDALRSGETAVELIQYQELDWNTHDWSGEKRYAAIISNHGDTVLHYVLLCTESAIERLFEKAGAHNGNANGVSRLCYQPLRKNKTAMHLDDSLAALILEPLLPFFKNSTVIYISPVGLLNRIPFQAISYHAKGPLAKYYTVRNLLSTGSLVNRREKETILLRTAGIWYNINYGSPVFSRKINPHSWLGIIKEKVTMSWEPLKGNLLIPYLAKWLHEAGISYYLFDQKKASEATFKQMDPSISEILHVETHGFSVAVKPIEFAPLKQDYYLWQARNPMLFTGLFMADSKFTWQGVNIQDVPENGILTAYEVAQLDFHQSRLVVLGACETGLGQIKGNEGVYGLGRAFKIAGADKIIMSLWSVPDEASQKMFRFFYRNWLTRRLPLERAFRDAQMEVYKIYKSPYFWAGFVLVE